MSIEAMTRFECGTCGARYDERVRFCLSCERFDSVGPSRSRPLDQMWADPVLMSAAEIRSSPSRVKPLGCYGIACAPASLIAIYGPPGSMKSTMACRLLDSLEGNVLYLPVEEGVRSDAVHERLQRMEIFRSGFLVADVAMIGDLNSALEADYVAVCIDSINVVKLKGSDLRNLADAKGIVVVFVMQVNKQGAPAGEMSDLHLADVVIRVDSGQWEIEKSRYGPVQKGSVCPE